MSGARPGRRSGSRIGALSGDKEVAVQRPRATPDLRFVFHPEADDAYRHFDGHAAVPFDPRAGTVTRGNAWWLAEAALLTYWDPGEARPRFAAAGLDAELIEGGDTQAYVAKTPGAVLVVFRGTEPDHLGDTLDDAGVALVRWTHGAVHDGFRHALERVWTPLAARLAALGGSRPVWFGGHSLGAAVATLAADRFPDTAGVCTLGSPRVGDRAFAAAFDARFGDRAARYVNDADIVTHVPTPFPLPYAHVGRLRQITPDGRVTSQPPMLAHFVQDVFGDVGHLHDVVEALQAGVIRRAPDFLLDHMPRGYTTDIWNDHDAHGTT
jgi:triacylglycerol lipase